MADGGREEICFTFLWKLENISYCSQEEGGRIESPNFMVEEAENTKWRLWLFPRGDDDGNYIGLYLYRATHNEEIEKVELKYELAFVSKDGTVLVSRDEENYSFRVQKASGFDRFHERKDVFFFRRSAFLPEDTLRVRCRIWKRVGQMTEAVRCVACTRIGVQKRSFVWNEKNLSPLQMRCKLYEIKSFDTDKPLISVYLYLIGGIGSEETLCFRVTPKDKRVKFSTFHVSVVNASGHRIECHPEEVWFLDESEPKEFKYVLSRNNSITLQDFYQPLSLDWEWVFSEGVISEKIEEVQRGYTNSESKCSDIEMDCENTMPSPFNSNLSLKSLLDENFLCDVQLQTETRTFSAHKIILSAFSAVFKVMFSSDMKEKESNSVNIDDLNDDTVGRMLHYIYTTRVEDLTWETACNLYSAADKYAIFGLKSICCTYLKDNLTARNACKILLLSDLHSDNDLKFSAQGYILRYIKDIVKSEEWKLLMETNAMLAAETVCLQYK